MRVQQFFAELKRRNVFRVATAYAIAGWLIIQIVTVIEQPLALPDWFDTMIIILVSIGFPLALIFAWAFELTPEGIKKSEEVEITESVTKATGKKINGIIISALSLLVVFLLVERFFFAPVVRDIEVTEVSTVSSQSVAVLPFADLSENGDQEWFSDGLTEEILNSLAQLPELKVTSRTSAFQFKNKDIDISLIADTLGVANVVEGSVRRIGEQLRITAQLIRAEDGFHLWSETYDSSTEDLFDVQTSIAEEIANTLDVYLDEAKRERLFSSGTRNVEAFEAYLKGRELSGIIHDIGNHFDLPEANIHFKRAMELDPEFGEPSLFHMDAFAHVLVEGQVLKDSTTLEEALLNLQSDMEFAINRVEDPILKVSAEITALLFSDSWYQLPGFVEELKNLMAESGLRKIPNGAQWTSEALSLIGELELRGSDNYEEIQVNPLSAVAWNYYADYKYSTEGLESFLETMNESRKSLGFVPFHKLFEDLIIAIDRDYELLKSRNPDGISINSTQIPVLMASNSYVAAMLDQDELALELIEKYKQHSLFLDSFVVLTMYELGFEEEAKAIVNQLDSQPAGPANLSLDIVLFGNTLFFNLEDAPNTAARFNEAGIDVSQFRKMPWVE